MCIQIAITLMPYITVPVVSCYLNNSLPKTTHSGTKASSFKKKKKGLFAK